MTVTSQPPASSPACDDAGAYADWTWGYDAPVIWAPGTAGNQPELAPVDFWSAGGSCG
jgi:hypothetical protein